MLGRRVGISKRYWEGVFIEVGENLGKDGILKFKCRKFIKC